MNNQSRGILTIISGFSGAGKGTVIKALQKKYPDAYKLSVSATTRQPRLNKETNVEEKEGIDYFFKTVDEFKKLIADDQMLEYAEYSGNFYGTPRAYVEEQLDAGYDVILEIEQQGAFQVKDKLPDTLMLFLAPPTIEELETRLRKRGTETEEVILRRMKQAAVESKVIPDYDYLVINDTVDACVEKIHTLIETEHQRVGFNKEQIEKMQKDLQKYE